MSQGVPHKRADLPIRAGGVLLLGIAWFAARALRHLAQTPPHHQASAVALLLAAIAFLTASIGCALLSLGCHLFDQIEVSGRWRNAHPLKLEPIEDDD